MVEPAASFGEDLDNGAEVCDPSDNDEGSVIEEEVIEPPSHSTENQSVPVVESAPEAQEDVPKQSYAAIVSCCFFFFCFWFLLLHVLLHFVVSSMSDYY